MEYHVILRKPDGKPQLIGTYNNKDRAMIEGKATYDNMAKKGESVVLISGNVNADGNIAGAYRLYERWA